MIKKLLLATLFLSSCLPFSEEELNSKKRPFFSSAYVECNRSFHWNFTYFSKNTFLHPTNSEQIGLFSDVPTGRSSSGTGYSSPGPLSDAELSICSDIASKLYMGDSTYTSNYMYQYFDKKDLYATAKLGTSFSPISEKPMVLVQRTYRWHENKNSTYVGTLELPLNVNCEEKWSVKKTGLRGEELEFKQPDGKCNFSLLDFELKLLNGQKITIALSGYYKKDPEYPSDRVMLQIEHYGFKR
jgi:hypothetical protein